MRPSLFFSQEPAGIFWRTRVNQDPRKLFGRENVAVVLEHVLLLVVAFWEQVWEIAFSARATFMVMVDGKMVWPFLGPQTYFMKADRQIRSDGYSQSVFPANRHGGIAEPKQSPCLQWSASVLFAPRNGIAKRGTFHPSKLNPVLVGISLYSILAQLAGTTFSLFR